MSPLRGRYYYGSYSSISDAWHNEVDFSMERLYEPKSMFIAGFAFDVLTLIALIGFLVWACLIRNPRGSLKGVVSSIVTWLMYVKARRCTSLTNANL